MKRVSMVLAGPRPGPAGTTRGRSSNDTQQAAGFGWLAVYGSSMSCRGGLRASASIRAKTSLRTATLSAIGNPPWAMWKTPAVVRRSLAGLCRTPLASR